jgi:hypothetical protein
MWNRFNYFVAIQCALIGGKFVLSDARLVQGGAIAGAVLAPIWYIMGSEGRYLVMVYRKQVEDAGRLIERPIWEDKSIAYRHAGEIEMKSENVPQRLSGWRLKALSTTKLASLIPLILTLTWIGVLVRGLWQTTSTRNGANMHEL